MAHRYLGEPFDIHGGGADLIFPHHENEIAQSEGAFGDGQFAHHWIHSGMVNFGGEKMSKSLGNVVTIRKVAETHDLEALRLHLIGVHYRSPVAFTSPATTSGARALPGDRRGRGAARLLLPDAGAAGGGARRGRRRRGGRRPPTRRSSSFNEAMDDDFNTAAAIGHLSEAFLLANKLLDEPKAARQGRPAAHAGAAAQGSRRLRRDAGDLPAPAGRVPRRATGAALRAARHRPGRRRGAHRRARRRPHRQGLRPRRRDPRARSRRRGVELMDTPAGTTWRVTEPPVGAEMADDLPAARRRQPDRSDRRLGDLCRPARAGSPGARAGAEADPLLSSLSVSA